MQLELKLPKAPTFAKYLPSIHFVHEFSAAAATLCCPYLPVPQLMQRDSFVAPMIELHLPLGHPLQSLATDLASNSEYVPLVQLWHPAEKFVALVCGPK